MDKKNVSYLIHIPVWIVVLSFVFVIAYMNKNVINLSFLVVNSTIIAFWLLSSFYMFYSHLVPKYLEKKKFFSFTSRAALFIIVVIPAVFVTLALLNFHFNKPEHFTFNRILYLWIQVIIATLICSGIGSLYRFMIDWFLNLEIKKDYENKNLKSELKTLKAQLNPHLLFNTLNNIHTLIENSPKKASEVLTKLSDLLRYVVYDTEGEKVSLRKEIDNLNKYIELERIRVVNPDSIIFKTDIMNEDNIMIPPMIFFPFVENGFKHCNLNNIKHKLSISISNKNGQISFECINSIIEKPQKTEYNGVGLELVRKRLELLFPKRHELTIQQKENEFEVKLQINIDQ